VLQDIYVKNVLVASFILEHGIGAAIFANKNNINNIAKGVDELYLYNLTIRYFWRNLTIRY